MQLQDIQFPIFKVPSRVRDDFGVLYVETPYGDKVLDNKRLPGSLVERRSKLPHQSRYTPKVLINTPEELIRHKTPPGTRFMDKNGNLFSYTRKKFVRLRFYKIEKIIRLRRGVAIELENIPCRLRYEGPLPENCPYAAVLEDKYGFMLYGFSEKKLQDSRRKI